MQGWKLGGRDRWLDGYMVRWLDGGIECYRCWMERLDGGMDERLDV